jgi:putative solute:sodium symporter small subunit
MSKEDYWNANTKLITIVLAIWFVVSYLASIVFVDQLNSIQIAGYKLGFWFAQQGAMYVFVILIFWYSNKMDRLDKEYINEDNN